MVLCKEKRAARREIVYRNIIHYFILYTVSARVQEILWKLSDFNGLTIFGVFDLQGRRLKKNSAQRGHQTQAGAEHVA